MLPPGSFLIDRSFRVPGLGLLVLPTAPAPSWLAEFELHTARVMKLHRPGQLSLLLPATIEELTPEGQPAIRALLLDADPGRDVPAGAWLQLTLSEDGPSLDQS